MKSAGPPSTPVRSSVAATAESESKSDLVDRVVQAAKLDPQSNKKYSRALLCAQREYRGRSRLAAQAESGHWPNIVGGTDCCARWIV